MLHYFYAVFPTTCFRNLSRVLAFGSHPLATFLRSWNDELFDSELMSPPFTLSAQNRSVQREAVISDR
jgi:hypothetical protein